MAMNGQGTGFCISVGLNATSTLRAAAPKSETNPLLPASFFGLLVLGVPVVPQSGIGRRIGPIEAEEVVDEVERLGPRHNHPAVRSAPRPTRIATMLIAKAKWPSTIKAPPTERPVR